ncbi:FAD-dependent oxidoreductase [Paenibacillus sp. GCM10027628]|uniref:FAD-dependent oxidoreductase n=1 Tax=Paenibacillus sp. GCM10027628 TaxID=3273413 RepID=UPI003633BECA
MSRREFLIKGGLLALAASGTFSISRYVYSSVAGSSDKKDEMHYDIVVYGGTAAGIIAAVQAAKMGKKVALLEPSARLGGMSSGGLGYTDLGNKSVIGGLALEFYSRIGKKYGKNEPVWIFEPKVALEVCNDFISEYNIPVFYNERLNLTDGVVKIESRIQSIAMESGKKFNANMFIDATYEGDLMAKANVSYAVGREANSTYGETLNGVQTVKAKGHQLPSKIDPFNIKGDPQSGLLPHVNPVPGTKDGIADKGIQAYCFRVCFSTDPNNRVFIEKPEGYNEREYEILFRAIEAGQKEFFTLTGVPNHKTDSNNSSGISFDYIGANYEYPDADYKKRAEIIKAHEVYQKGFIWTLQNHPRVPESIRKFYQHLGLPLDEFVENGHWPTQLYIREARRMISDLVMNEKHIMLHDKFSDPVGMGSYTMDSHHVERYVDTEGYVRNEGNIEAPVSKPYPVSYRAMVPFEKECTNVIVPVCVAASHIAYGSVRMEPVFMILGQSAATAAVLAIDQGLSVQKLDYNTLQLRLKSDGQVLSTNA